METNQDSFQSGLDGWIQLYWVDFFVFLKFFSNRETREGLWINVEYGQKFDIIIIKRIHSKY